MGLFTIPSIFGHMKKLFLIIACGLLLVTASRACAERIITDAAGRKVKIPDNVSRLVTTFKPATLMVLCLKGADAFVGLDNSSRHDPLVLAVAPELADLPGVGSKSSGINLETVLSLNPDLVILSYQKTGVQMADRLQNSGCPAVVIAPETFASIKQTLIMVASAIGKPRRADAVIQAMERVLARVGKRVQNLDPGERKTVYYAGPSGFLSTSPSGMLQDRMIHLAGGINAAHGLHGHFKQISPEQLMTWAPESIVISPMSRFQAKTFINRRQFSLLPAVRENEIHVFPSSLSPWDFPSPLSVMGVLWLGNRLYPEQFEDICLLHEINDFHEILFDQSFTKMGGHLNDKIECKDPEHPPQNQNAPNGNPGS